MIQFYNIKRYFSIGPNIGGYSSWSIGWNNNSSGGDIGTIVTSQGNLDATNENCAGLTTNPNNSGMVVDTSTIPTLNAMLYMKY